MIAYKFLRTDGSTAFSRFRWPAPREWVEAPVVPCRSGVHACRPADLPYWVAHTLYEIELDGEIVESPMKVVATRGRLLRRITEWEDGVAEEYTRMCADRAHELARGASPPLEQWEAAIEPSVPEGPALLGFMAARIAEELDGPDAYRAERARQTNWLVEQLRL
jgi:hypothetical protein